MNKDTFCSLPFNGFFLGSDGGVRPCCSLLGTIGNINKNTVDEIVNGPIVQSIRQSIVNNEWHEMCGLCKESESRGANNERVFTLEHLERMSHYPSTKYQIEKLDIRWSNTCNLACNYCYEYFSSKWAEIKGVKVNANKDDSEDKVFSYIEKNVDTIKYVNLLGGEPLLQKPNHKLLEILKADTKILIVTNLSVELTTNKIAQKLLKNSDVNWCISFETVNKRFEYVRHGADWKQFTKNLRHLAQSKVKQIEAFPAYCLYSAFNLIEYYDFIEGEGYFNNINWQMLQEPKGLDVFQLPNSMKNKALKELEDCFSKFGNKFNMSMLENIYNGLLESTKNIENTNESNNFLKYLDTHIHGKETNFKILWPDVYEDIVSYLTYQS